MKKSYIFLFLLVMSGANLAVATDEGWDPSKCEKPAKARWASVRFRGWIYKDGTIGPTPATEAHEGGAYSQFYFEMDRSKSKPGHPIWSNIVMKTTGNLTTSGKRTTSVAKTKLTISRVNGEGW